MKQHVKRTHTLALAVSAALLLSSCATVAPECPPNPQTGLLDRAFCVVTVATQKVVSLAGSVTTGAIEYTARVGVGVARLAGAATEKAFDLTVKATEGAVDLAQDASKVLVDLAGNALLENIRLRYQTLEGQLNASIKVVEENNNQQTKRYAAYCKKSYEDNRKLFLAMQKEIKQGVIEQAKLKNTIADYDNNIALIKDNLAVHEAKLADYKDLRKNLIGDRKLNSSERKALANLDKRINELHKDIESIREVYSKYVSERDVLNVACNAAADTKASA